MKKWFAFLLALLMMCACLPAVHAAGSEFPVPVDAKDVPLPDCMKSDESDLKVQHSDNKWTFSWGKNSFENAETSLYVFVSYSTEEEPDGYIWVEKEDIVKTEKGWSYTWDAPKDLAEDSVYFCLSWEKGTDEKGRTDFYQSYTSWDDAYSKSYDVWEPGKADMVGGVSDSFGISDNNITSYTSDGVYGTYRNGKLRTYSYFLDDENNQNIEFDVYGRPVYSSMWGSRDDHYYEWSKEEGWFYWDDGEVYYVDSLPKGAVNPESLNAPFALAIPKTPPIENTTGQGVMTKLPVSLNDLADVEEAGFVENGSYAVTLSGDLQAHDYTTDSTHTGFADLGVFYVLDGELYETWFLGNEDSVKKDGDTYYFVLPDGAEVLCTRVDMNIYNGNQLYYSYKDDDGAWDSMFYDGLDGKDDENFTYEYWYNEDGELHSIGAHNEVDGSVVYWHFNGSSGELKDYEIEAETDYWISYHPDGSLKEANYAGQYYWEPDIGWYEEAWDEETGAWVVVPAKAPAGLKDPSEYPAPYVFAKEAEAPTWYPHNTVCVGGLAFRDVKPELTKKWYNFVPVDLSQDSVQTFELVASNKFVVGTVTVTRTGDEVVVDWALRKQGTTDANFVNESEFLTFFSSLDAVTEVEPEWFNGPVYHFGEPISIEKDLGGDTNVLLYIRNVATYCENLSYKYQRPIFHAVYNAKDKNHQMLQETMLAIMEADSVK